MARTATKPAPKKSAKDSKSAPKAPPKVEKPAINPKIKLDPNSVEVGDLMAVVYYVKVKDKKSDALLVDDLFSDLTDIQVRGKELISNCRSADQYSIEVKTTKTEAAQILVNSYNTPLTVAFEKLDGTERVLRGLLVQPEPLLGRSHVEDLDIPRGQHRLRLVDHRSILWLVVNGTRYVVK